MEVTNLCFISKDVSLFIKNYLLKQQQVNLLFFEEIVFRKRVAKILANNNVCIDNEEEIIYFLNNNLNKFLHYIFPEINEILRNEFFWNNLKTFLIKIKQINNQVLFYNLTSGEELYSFCIMLHELQLNKNYNITVTCPSEITIEKIKQGIIITTAGRNYLLSFKNVFNYNSAEKYFDVKGKNINFKFEFLKNITFIKCNIPCNLNKSFDIVFARNKSMYFNKQSKQILNNNIQNLLNNNGIYINGSKEFVDNTFNKVGYCIYKKNEK